jgi:hypothetical protein
MFNTCETHGTKYLAVCLDCASDLAGQRRNALGNPAPNRTDFTAWERKTLEAFARQAADDNLVLRADNKVLLEQWRTLVKSQASTPPPPGEGSTP